MRYSGAELQRMVRFRDQMVSWAILLTLIGVLFTVMFQYGWLMLCGAAIAWVWALLQVFAVRQYRRCFHDEVQGGSGS